MKQYVRNIFHWLMEFLPMYQMQIRVRYYGQLKVFDASEGIDWFLPRLKKRIADWNETAGNPKGDPEQEQYAWYVRIR